MNERELRDRIFANFYDPRDKAREEEAEYLRMKKTIGSCAGRGNGSLKSNRKRKRKRAQNDKSC